MQDMQRRGKEVRSKRNIRKKYEKQTQLNELTQQASGNSQNASLKVKSGRCVSYLRQLRYVHCVYSPS